MSHRAVTPIHIYLSYDLYNGTQESIVSAVKPTRPSQPPRWHMPTDISLKAALKRAKEDGLETSRSGATSNFGTGKGTTSVGTASSSLTRRGGKVRPVYELYKDCETVVNLVVELHR